MFYTCFVILRLGGTKLKIDNKETIIVKQGTKIRYIQAADVIYIESLGRKVLLHLTSEIIEYYAKISILEAQLIPDFFRIHRAYLINLHFVEDYNKREARMSNQDLVLISKYRLHEFQKTMCKYTENACKMKAKGLKCSKYME